AGGLLHERGRGDRGGLSVPATDLPELHRPGYRVLLLGDVPGARQYTAGAGELVHPAAGVPALLRVSEIPARLHHQPGVVHVDRRGDGAGGGELCAAATGIRQAAGTSSTAIRQPGFDAVSILGRLGVLHLRHYLGYAVYGADGLLGVQVLGIVVEITLRLRLHQQAIAAWVDRD